MAGIAAVLMVAAAGLGVDIGHLALSANEAQVVADAAAIAGARSLAEGGTASVGAHAVAGLNSMAGSTPAPEDVIIETGMYDRAAATFSPGGASPTAVRATAVAEVSNFFAAIFGVHATTVQRAAIAATDPLASGTPTLPMALSDCHFPPDCTDADCLPTLQRQPNSEDNSGLTGFFDNANDTNLVGMLAAPCGDGNEIPTVSVGDHISLNDGDVTTFMKALECVVCTLGQREFVVPIITHCDEDFGDASPPLTGDSPDGVVYGFATIVIDSINYGNGETRDCTPGGGAPLTVNLHSVERIETGAGGGPCTGCGTSGIALVQ